MKLDKPTDRRAAILQAAGKLFSIKGVEGTTTLDIASAAGVSKRDLYALFPSKDLILSGLIASSVERFAAPVQFADAKSRAEVLATLEAFSRGFLAFLLSPEPTSLYRLAIATADRIPAVGKALLSAGVEGTIGRVTAYVSAACVAGHLRIPEAERGAAVSAYFNSAIGHLQMRRLLDPATEIAPDAISANVQQAMRVLLSFESN
jgi:AcrR family transcriptional regulator